MKKFVKLAQIVDTLKLHVYHGEATTSRALVDYAKTVASLSDLKDEAYAIKHTNNDMRFVNYVIGHDRFRVMATTIRGFSVTIQNNDLSISFKTVSNKMKINEYPEGYDLDTVVETPVQPVIRVEFRASFLARVGHTKAINYALELITKHFFCSYKIKVSEIHLATDIQGYSFRHLDFQRIRTRKSRSEAHDTENSGARYFYQGRKFTGFSLGGGDDMLRIYNKTVEIKKFPDKEFIKHLVWDHHPDYDPYADVWRIEIQYRREKLKTIYDSKNGLLDGFENVIASIPSLWNLALDNVTLVDLSDSICNQHYLGYFTNEKGEEVPIQNETVIKRIYRASIHPLWQFLKGWVNSIGNATSIHDAPKTGAFRWVSNAIKSVLSTAYKHYGDLSPKLLEDAFERAQGETIEDKGMSLVDNAVANSLAYVGHTIRYAHESGKEGYVERDSFSTLVKNLSAYVREITRNLFDVFGTKDDYVMSRAKILNKSLQRAFA